MDEFLDGFIKSTLRGFDLTVVAIYVHVHDAEPKVVLIFDWPNALVGIIIISL